MDAVIGAVIERRSAELLAVGRQLAAVPEAGFCEVESTKIIVGMLEEAGLPITAPLAVTGVSALLSGGKPGPTVAVMGELDAVLCPDHAEADKESGYAHVCGHHVSAAAVVGAAWGLLDERVRSRLCGNVLLMAVPGEEFVDLGRRSRWIQEGWINYCSGKQELIRCQLLSGVSAVVSAHVHDQGPAVVRGTYGLVGFVIRSKAKDGVRVLWELNALVAALNQDEGLRRLGVELRAEADHGVGEDRACMLYVSAPDQQGLTAGCTAAACRLTTISHLITEQVILPGALPLQACTALNELCNNIMAQHFVSPVCYRNLTTYTDAGDVSMFMPTAVLLIGGGAGELHTPAFSVQPSAVIDAAVILARCVYKLLSDDAVLCQKVTAAFPSPLTHPDQLKQTWADICGS